MPWLRLLPRRWVVNEKRGVSAPLTVSRYYSLYLNLNNADLFGTAVGKCGSGLSIYKRRYKRKGLPRREGGRPLGIVIALVL